MFNCYLGDHMALRLPNNLSPRARKRLLMARVGEVDRALIQVAPTANLDKLQRWVHEAGGTVRSWSDETRLMSVDLPAYRFGDLAAFDGVDYVEVGGRYGP
jgi:hypothetical protein